ncbi:MAG: aldo/keto reductase [Eubacteriales bacterium]|nr:aldo/keto reductase [Eubacteriales bacterium]
MGEYMTLTGGVKMPKIGYGTYKCTDGSDETVVRTALEAGYRLLDTAAAYENEEQVGKAVRGSGVPREEIFLTSKVWKTHLGYENTKRSVEESLERLGTDYLDLLLLHWPKPDPESKDWKLLDQESWRALEEFYREGKARAIGLSNFLPHHVDAILEMASVEPMVDQLELHVGYMQAEAVAYCKKRGIKVQAWSPLGRRRMLENPIVGRMAEKYGVLPAQFLLKYLFQHDIGVIPKASSFERMRQNLELPEFTIAQEDLQLLDCLPQMGWSGEHPDLPRVAAQE